MYGLNIFKIFKTKISGITPVLSKTLSANSFSIDANFFALFIYSLINSDEISYFLSSLKVFNTSTSVLK